MPGFDDYIIEGNAGFTLIRSVTIHADMILQRLGSLAFTPVTGAIQTVSTTPSAGTPKRALAQVSDIEEKRQGAGVNGPGDLNLVTGPTKNTTTLDNE